MERVDRSKGEFGEKVGRDEDGLQFYKEQTPFTTEFHKSDWNKRGFRNNRGFTSDGHLLIRKRQDLRTSFNETPYSLVLRPIMFDRHTVLYCYGPLFNLHFSLKYP